MSSCSSFFKMSMFKGGDKIAMYINVLLGLSTYLFSLYYRLYIDAIIIICENVSAK